MGFSVAADLFPLAAALLAALSCGLLGNFLVLRRQSLMGDAISHSVLPGLVIAFLVTQSRSPTAMFLGAAAAGVATVVIIEVIKKLGRVEPGAAMGVVFSLLFALGVLLIERGDVRGVDLDAECVLHGQLETLAWYASPPPTLADLFTGPGIAAVPTPVWTLLGVFAAASVFVVLFYKELRIAAFDPQLATSQGINATALHMVFMVFVAAATVASFEAVGSILVVAMLICPAATARLLTDRLAPQILASLAAAFVAAVGGYTAAAVVPGWWGKDTVSAAGTMTLVAGALVVLAAVASPSHGVVAVAIRRARLARRVAIDDLLAMLYRRDEQRSGRTPAVPIPALAPGGAAYRRAIRVASQRGLVREGGGEPELTPAGARSAEDVVRRHRLWEHYLVERAGLAPDHVHDPAERLEHLPIAPTAHTRRDPHGKPIPRGEDEGRDPG